MTLAEIFAYINANKNQDDTSSNEVAQSEPQADEQAKEK